MAIFSDLINYINQLDTKTLFKYIGIYLAGVVILLLGVSYLYYSKLKKHTKILETTQSQALETKNIINNFLKVQEQQEDIQKILDQDKTFRILPIYENVIQSLGLSRNSSPDLQSTVNRNLSIQNKTERVLKAQLTNVNTKNLVQLLSKLAEIKQIYPKDLIIKKSNESQNVNIEITLATLESEVQT